MKFGEIGHARIDDKIIRVVGMQLPDSVVSDFIATLDPEARQTYRHQPNMANEVQWFAFADGRIVAYGSLENVSADEVSFGCVVHQDYRGRGLGKFMYSFASVLAMLDERKVITAEQDHENFAARSICEREGFTFSEPIADPSSSSGWIVRLRKEL